MEPRIETIPEKKLTGLSLTMTLADNKTAELWRSFMPRRKEIKNNLKEELISLQSYEGALDLKKFTANTPFKKWAAVEVPGFDSVPDGMETFVLPAGLYAVFTHRGSSADNSTFEYIFTRWLPNAAYELDDRPHFEVLGEKYRNNDPASEEEIWIPVKLKN